MGYHTIENIGTAGRGTEMIVREDLQMDRIKRIPSGRGITAYYKNICLINICAIRNKQQDGERNIFQQRRNRITTPKPNRNNNGRRL